MSCMVTTEVPVSTYEKRDICDVCNNEVVDEMTFTDSKNNEEIHIHYKCFENWRDDYEMPTVNDYAVDADGTDVSGSIRYMHGPYAPINLVIMCVSFGIAGLMIPIDVSIAVLCIIIGVAFLLLLCLWAKDSARKTIRNLP